MAVGVKPWCRLCAAAGALGAIIAAYAGMAQAQALPDPTRPPPQAALAAGSSGAAGAPAAPLLQSVFIGPNGRSAIIDGRRYAQGARVGEARLVRIGETEVVLRGPGGSTTLKLFPHVDKRPAGRDQPARHGAPRKH